MFSFLLSFFSNFFLHLFSYCRISGEASRDFDFDPGIMEIFIVGYVIAIRKKLGNGEWIFNSLNGTSAPKLKEFSNNYGIFATKNLIKINFNFDTWVQNCLDDEASLLEAAQNAALICPHKAKKPRAKRKKPQKDNVFLDPDGYEYEANEEILTLFFRRNPKAFLEFDGLFKILPDGVLNTDEPIVKNLVDQLGDFHKELKDSQASNDDSENVDANPKPRKKRKKNSSKAIIHDEADEDNGSCSE